MNILVVGCDKVGSRLANVLCRMGHDVVVIDKNRENFTALDDDFDGFTVEGVPIDQDVLREAGIIGCDALAAVTNDDNTNAMVCQIAKEIFGVPRVLASIFDPNSEAVFKHFGIKMVCPTNLTVSAVYSLITDRDQTKHVAFDDTVISYATSPVPRNLIGTNIMDLVNNCDEKESVFGILHEDGSLTLINGSKYILLESDRLLFARVAD
ncbi:MAG: TrkA family potassium uptake protein [Oscillospiraceae bacterium]|nr:TrkA family potassium uptake protein [Oscillospiraceae bacterium]